MQTQPDVAILVDNPNRDLPACILLAQYIAAHSELQVALVQMNRAVTTLFALAPRYVLLNYARPNNARLIAELQASRISVGVLDTEGGVFTVMPQTGELNYFNTVIKDDAIRSHVKHYFIWGKAIFDAIREKNLYRPGQLFLTGTPRSDFYHSDFALPDGAIEKIILVNTSFALTNPKFSSFANEMHMLQKIFGYEQTYLDELAKQIFKVEQVMIEQVRALAIHFPEQKIIFRPHPFENEKKYVDLFCDIPNIRVVCDGTVDQWLRKAILMLHYECSTALEAACLNVPALSPAGYQSIRPIREANSVTHFYSSIDELFQLTKDILDSRYVTPPSITTEIQKTLENVYYSLDGKSHRRIGDVILKFLGTSSNSPSGAWKYNLKHHFRFLIKRILRHNLPPASKALTFDIVQPIFENLQRHFSQNLQLKSYKTHHLISKKS